tara:strand:+ start:820 stop:1617 length:798 start_codon:yes stop_codon:yes gene_type:complete
MSLSIKLRNNENINNNSYISDLKTQIDKSNDLIDSIVNESYNYKFNTKSDNFDEINTIQNNEISLNNIFIDDISRVSHQLDKTIINSLDSNRNQKHMNKFIKEQKDTIIRKNVNVLKELDESNKKMLINHFYYKKNKAQFNILYYLLIVIILLLTFNYLNKYFKIILNDTLFIILSVSLISVYFVYLCFQLYDLYARSDRNIDEYDFNTYLSASIKGINKDDTNLDNNTDLRNGKEIDLKNNKCVKEMINYFDKDNVINDSETYV